MLFAEDNFLLSSENLRASPELWPEKVPGSDNFTKTAHKAARENENGLTQEDIRMIYRKYRDLKTSSAQGVEKWTSLILTTAQDHDKLQKKNAIDKPLISF